MRPFTEHRRWLAVVAAAAPLWLLALGGTVAAHASIEEIVPADGALLGAPPVELTVRFTEAITEQFVAVRLLATERDGAAGGVREFALSARRDPLDDHRLLVALPPLGEGLYQVKFTVRDREDLHQVDGRTSFAVGEVAPPPPRPATRAPASPIESASRWIFASGLALLAGVLTFRGRWPDTPIARPGPLAALAGAGLAAVIAGRLGVVAARAFDLGIGLRPGLAHVARTGEVRQLPVVALAAACTVPAVAARWLPVLDLPAVPGRRASIRSLLGWIGVTWLALLAGTRDHSALGGRIEWEVAAAKALHLVGLGVWIGVLVVSLAVGGSRAGRIAALDAVKRAAFVGFAITVGSGLLLAGRLVVSITGLLTTQYGLLLTAKLALIPAAVGCGMAARRCGPRLAVVEGAVLGAVVAAGTLMATAAPAIEKQFLPEEVRAAPVAVSVQADDLLIRLRAVPGRPGPNALEVQVASTRRAAPAAIRRLDIGVAGGTDGEVRSIVPDETGLVLVPDVGLPLGKSEVTVAVVRDGLAPTSVVVRMRTEAELYHSPSVVSSRPIRQPLRIAGVVTLGLAAVVITSRARRARRRGGQRCAPEPIATSV